MKFNHGYWLMQPEYNVHYAVHAAEVTISEQYLQVLASSKRIEHRGDTLNLPVLTFDYSAPMEDVIRVSITHHKGQKKKTPEFTIQNYNPEVTIAQKEDYVSLRSGNLSVRVSTQGDWNQAFFAHSGTDEHELTNSGWRNSAYIEKRLDCNALIGSEKTTLPGDHYTVEQLHLGPGETVYGLGERFTPFVKNGQSIDIWNEDAGTSSEQTYKNIPFYFTSSGYGVLVLNPGKVSMEVGSEKVSRVSFSVPEQKLEYLIIYGPDPKAILEKYTALCGRPSLPPAWSFGLWLSTSFTTDYDEETVSSFLQGMQDREIPVSVFHFDCFWMKQYSWTDFHWDPEQFPDPQSMLQRLKERGLKICVWINPYIAQHSAVFDEAADQGFLLMRPNGDVWQTDQWQAGMGIVDFTNPAAVSWYQAQLKKLLEMGVDAFKTDFGERIPRNVLYFDGSDPDRMHNYYPLIYNKAVFEVLAEEKGSSDAVLFARSATAGSQQYPVHWGGDCLANYDSMAESLRGGLSLCCSGFGFWSHDIGGFENTASPDLYKRWSAFGLLSTHSRLHGSSSYRVPWNFDEESVAVLQFFTTLKIRLMPYLYRYAAEASEKGIPLLRAMILEFQNDMNARYLDRQYLLGPDILVAPILNEDSKAEWYVPSGIWTSLLDGKVYEGNSWYEDTFDYFSLPLLVRPGAILIMGQDSRTPEYDYTDSPEIRIFQPRESGHSQIVLDSKGRHAGEVHYKIQNNDLLVEWSGLRDPDIIVYQGHSKTKKTTCSNGKNSLVVHMET